METGHICRKGSLAYPFLIARDPAAGWLRFSLCRTEEGGEMEEMAGQREEAAAELLWFGEARCTAAWGPTRHHRRQPALSFDRSRPVPRSGTHFPAPELPQQLPHVPCIRPEAWAVRDEPVLVKRRPQQLREVRAAPFCSRASKKPRKSRGRAGKGQVRGLRWGGRSK